MTRSDELRRELFVSLALYLALLAVSYLIGYRMNVPYGYYQFIGAELLETRLWESLKYLHSQPPLLNLALGTALKLSSASGVGVEAIVLVFHIALGALAVTGFTLTAGFLIESRLRRRICIGLLVTHPVFYMSLFNFFYTFHEIAILALLTAAAGVYFSSRRPWAFALLCVLLALMCLTRSLFHFIWAAGVAGFVLFAGREEHRTGESQERPRRAEWIALALMSVVLVAWPLKNWFVFGEFTSSTWFGYSFSKGLGLDLPDEDEIERPPPPAEFDIPVLTQVEKSDPNASGGNSKNWNHYALIGQFKDRGAQANEAIAHNPWLLARRAAGNYWRFSRFTGRHPYVATMGTIAGPAPPAAEFWLRVYEALLVQELRSPGALRHAKYREDPARFWHVSGFFFTFPLIVFLSILKVRRTWRGAPVEARVASVMLICTLWVFAVTLLIDGDEANRIRASTEPYWIALAIWALPAFRNRARN